ncbi:hypothetical protein BDV93DRAFT_610704 [Ceratobasidium sp. AG-I]|nr:hypothetical protein BDV93DRAFT_610704 [Ceratobasidium sp. AG-I]
MPAVPLPPKHSKLDGSPAAVTAYARLLPLESSHPVKTRLCGWMMIHAPSIAGRDYVVECVNRCTNDEEILAVGQGYLLYFVAYFKTKLHKPTPTSSAHPSRPSMDVLQADTAALLRETPQSHSNAKKLALARDNYRCMLSGHVDATSYEASAILQKMVHEKPGVNAAPTHCCHILPQYLNQRLGDPYRLDASASVWTVLRCFGDVNPEELNGEDMHRLGNILTLGTGYHDSFDRLRIWLEPVEGTEHQYLIGRSLPANHAEIKAPTVTFSTNHPELALPDRRYLALHAACAKVVHMSGAAHMISKILDEAEETKVLSGDGSSGELLAYLLSVEALMVY